MIILRFLGKCIQLVMLLGIAIVLVGMHYLSKLIDD